jgi:CubicO group peptidase (beta-lactamase class C family)
MYRQAFALKPTSQKGSMPQLVAALARLPLVFQPGTGWRYSLSHDVVGYLVEIISGLPFARFLEERLFQPLGMVDTSFVVPQAKVDRLSALYAATVDNGLQLQDAPATSDWLDPERLSSGGGGLASTAADYLRFAQMLLNGGVLDGQRLLSRKTVELMTRNHLPANLIPYYVSPGQPRPGYGYGLGVGVLRNGAEANEMMSDGSYQWNGLANTTWWNDPKEQLVGIMMTQVAGADLRPPFAHIFRNLVYQAIDD